MSNFWQGLGGKLTDQWVTALLTPAFAFWLGGFIAWLTHSGGISLKTVEAQVNQLTLVELIILLVVGFLIIAVSSSLVQRFDLTMLRWLEGYWPSWLNWLKDWCVGLQNKSLEKVRKRYEELEDKERQNSISPKEQEERVELALKLRLVPKNADDSMPTKLGNMLRAAENRPWERYGLDAIICWPRLWLLLPDGAKKEITESRATLDTAARLFLWSLLFMVWTVLAWWAPFVTLIVAYWAYRWALSAAEVYGDLLEAAFDMHRFALYETLRFPVPKDTLEEEAKGKQLTTYLFFGEVEDPVTFQTKQKQSAGAEDQQKEGNGTT